MQSESEHGELPTCHKIPSLQLSNLERVRFDEAFQRISLMHVSLAHLQFLEAWIEIASYELEIEDEDRLLVKRSAALRLFRNVTATCIACSIHRSF
jgi:hypothetical protein